MVGLLLCGLIMSMVLYISKSVLINLYLGDFG